MTGYSLDRLFEQVADIAYHFYWPNEQIRQLEHRVRQQGVAEIASIDRRLTEAEFHVKRGRHMSTPDLFSAAAQRADLDNSRIYGVVTGLVEDLRDPLNLGRVKVIFPWLAEPKEETVRIEDGEARVHSYWARVATLMAGKKRGTFIIPEVNDEVLVAFKHGQLDRPVVIGMLWNKEDQPPEKIDDAGKNDIRSITSRSGHRIVLNDSDDQPSILIADNTGDNSILIDTANKAMTFKVKGNLTFEVDGDITMKAKGKWMLDATGDVGLRTKGNLEAEATGRAKLEASGSLDVKSNTQVTVEGAAEAELKGGVVTVNGSAMAEIKGGLVKIN